MTDWSAGGSADQFMSANFREGGRDCVGFAGRRGVGAVRRWRRCTGREDGAVLRDVSRREWLMTCETAAYVARAL